MIVVIGKMGAYLSLTKVWAIFALIGFFFFNRNLFGRAIVLALFTIICTVFLKNLFQIPLPQPLEGFGFPSGHMNAAVIFWGWLAIELRRLWVAVATSVLLLWIGYGLVYEGYHYPIDIGGSIIYGSIVLSGYYGLTRLRLFHIQPYLLGILLSILGACVILITPSKARMIHTFIALYILMGFTVVWGLLNYLQQRSQTSSQSLPATLSDPSV